MIIQGSNNPLVVTFDSAVDDIPALVASLWAVNDLYKEPIKVWHKSDMTIVDDRAILPLDSDTTKDLPVGVVELEVKGLDDNGNTVFWDKYRMGVKARRDKELSITGGD